MADEYKPQIKHLPGGAKEQLGLSAVLIRPDGIIAWAVDENGADSDGLQEAITRWFVAT